METRDRRPRPPRRRRQKQLKTIQYKGKFIMADNQTIPATAFSVSGSADGFSVQGSYPFINEIRSEDTTIAVSNSGSARMNSGIRIGKRDSEKSIPK